MQTRSCVLVFSGLDPSGGAGLQADIQAIMALGSHPLPLVTVLTVQDNDRVFGLHPVSPLILQQQAQVLMDKTQIAAIKIGIVGTLANAEVIADCIGQLRAKQGDVPVILDPVLASGHGDALALENAIQVLTPLLPLATVITPNLPEAMALCGNNLPLEKQAQSLLDQGCQNVLIKGGHGSGAGVENHWFNQNGMTRSWRWSRLPGTFHGSGCTLASAIAALLAQGYTMEAAMQSAQAYCQQALNSAFMIADGQAIPNRSTIFSEGFQ